jgi:hypothetical protein
MPILLKHAVHDKKKAFEEMMQEAGCLNGAIKRKRSNPSLCSGLLLFSPLL